VILDLDFTVDSVSTMFKELIPYLKTVPRGPDLSVPAFIRNTKDYKLGLFDFDDESNTIRLAAAYYLGETFVRRFLKLRWPLVISNITSEICPLLPALSLTNNSHRS
jgi:hypothetical protein